MTSTKHSGLQLNESGVLRRAVRSALVLGVASTSLPHVAIAQETEATELDAIEVTGSRIKRPSLDSASPVTVIERDDIIATGITDVGDLLQRLPSMSGSPIGTETNNGGNGSVQIDLRGLGVNRTLTLVNGRRTVDGGDYQTIPASMIERVEILKDGGSAIYGADAVAGVVNIITRSEFEGMTLDAQTSQWFNTEGAGQVAVNMVTGKSFDGGGFVFGAEYVDQAEAYQSDTPWKFFQNSYYIYPEGCENQVTKPYPTGCYPIGSSRIPEGRLRFMTTAQGGSNQGTFMNPDGSGLVPYDGRTYNYAPVNYIQTPYERTNLFATADFELTKDIKLGTDFRANFRESAQELAPQPYNSPTDPAYDGVFNGNPFHGISEQNYYLVQATSAAGLLAEPVTDARRRMVEIPRRFTQDINQFQIGFDLSGTAMGVDWSAYYNKGWRDRTDRDFGQFVGSRLANALGPSADYLGADGLPGSDGVPECYTDASDPGSLIDGCVPFNMFGGPFSVTPEMLAYVGADLVDTFNTNQDEIAFNFTGNVGALPAGPVGWAAGYQYQGTTFQYNPDSGKQTDAVTGNTGLGTEGGLHSNALMGELFLPVFSNGEQAFNVKAGLRYDDYNRFDGETTWQGGLEFNALKSLKFRGTAGTVFRAPTISDLFSGQVDSFPTYTDPCDTSGGGSLPAGCAQVAPPPTDSQVLSKVGGNPDIQPESGDTMTLGVVWTPELEGGNNLSLTADYWQIKLEDGISSYGVQYILEKCYEDNLASFCDFVTRAADYSVAQVVDITQNVAEQGAKGIDFEVRYGFSPGMGRMNLALLWTHQLDRTKTAAAGLPEEDLSGRYTDPTAQDGGAYAADKANYSVRWTLPAVGAADLTFSYLGEYISSLDADTFCNCDSDGNPNNNAADGTYIQKIDAFLYHDLVAEVALNQWGTKFLVGITNVLDEEPPFIEVGFNATTDPTTYRMMGRGYFLRLEQEIR